MPEIYVFRKNNDRETIRTVRRYFDNLNKLLSDAVLISINADIKSRTGKYTPFIRIEASIDMRDDDVAVLASYFNSIIDVSVRFPLGAMVYHEEGHGFTADDVFEAKEATRKYFTQHVGFIWP